MEEKDLSRRNQPDGSKILSSKVQGDGMRIICDLHLHSPYSRGTSKEMTIENLSKYARLKGLNLLGSSDFTHPRWLRQLKQELSEIYNTGIFQSTSGFNFILSTEVCNIFVHEGKTRKVHNLILTKDFDVVDQINEQLKKFGNLEADGRPVFNGMSCAELVEILMEISKDIVVIPAHIYTPHFGVFGSNSGFNSLKECFQENTKYIFALETGLSSIPSMSYRISELDKYSLVSFSDSHSPWPWRIGREVCVLEIKELTFDKIIEAIKEKNNKNFLMTIEFPCEAGKYHWDGHRNCNISLHPKDAIKLNNICPKCGKKLTIGVLHRVEELADRPEGFVPKDAIPFKTLLPLYEIISFAWGSGELYSKKVLEEHDKLIKNFGNELNVLLNVSKEELLKVTKEKIADAIIKVREGKVKYQAGYDGRYGRPIFGEKIIPKQKSFHYQKSLTEFKSIFS